MKTPTCFEVELSVDQTPKLNCLTEPRVAMDTLIEFVSQAIGDKSGVVEVLLATFPAVLFLSGGCSLRCSAIAILIGAATLVLFGIGGVAGAGVVVIAEIVVVSIAVLNLRKRVLKIQADLDATKSAVRDLEITEGRRQVFNANARD